MQLVVPSSCHFKLAWMLLSTVYPKKYAHGFCFAVLCCGYTLTDFPISIRLTSLALWQSNDCPSASKATLMNMDKYFMWIHYERLHTHNEAKYNKTVCIFLGIYCICACVFVCVCAVIVPSVVLQCRLQWSEFLTIFCSAPCNIRRVAQLLPQCTLGQPVAFQCTLDQPVHTGSE